MTSGPSSEGNVMTDAVQAVLGGGERGAELVLARLADARVMMASGLAVRVTAVAASPRSSPRAMCARASWPGG
jgi:hypothetical protein